jgi:hypothetical protein
METGSENVKGIIGAYNDERGKAVTGRVCGRRVVIADALHAGPALDAATRRAN